jgi:hypothetical protein
MDRFARSYVACVEALFVLVSGVDVLITIFCDFADSRRKNRRFSQKPMS